MSKGTVLGILSVCLQVYTWGPLCSVCRAKGTQNSIPVLWELLLLWESHDPTHEGIMQELRQLIVIRWYACCLFLEGSRKSVAPQNISGRNEQRVSQWDEWWLSTRTLGFSPAHSLASPFAEHKWAARCEDKDHRQCWAHPTAHGFIKEWH